MDYNNLPGNSHKEKTGATKQKPRMEKVITGSATARKKTLGQQIKSLFALENKKDIEEYIFTNIFIPAAKKMLDESFSGVIDFLGDAGRALIWGPNAKPRRSSNARVSYTSYSSYYDRNDSSNTKTPPIARIRRGYQIDDIVLPTKMDADNVLESMEVSIEEFGWVTVLDLYDMCGREDLIRETDNDFGWTDISGARAVRDRDGWILDLPRCKALK
jgi:hypothetical protein